MKICITSQGDNLGSQMDKKFGRAPYFIIIDPATKEFEAIKNPNVDGMGGVGIQTGQLMSEKGVKAVLTGSIGPNAFQILKAANIEMITGITDLTVEEEINKYNAGELKSTDKPTVDSNFGKK